MFVLFSGWREEGCPGRVLTRMLSNGCRPTMLTQMHSKVVKVNPGCGQTTLPGLPLEDTCRESGIEMPPVFKSGLIAADGRHLVDPLV